MFWDIIYIYISLYIYIIINIYILYIYIYLYLSLSLPLVCWHTIWQAFCWHMFQHQFWQIRLYIIWHALPDSSWHIAGQSPTYTLGNIDSDIHSSFKYSGILCPERGTGILYKRWEGAGGIGISASPSARHRSARAGTEMGSGVSSATGREIQERGKGEEEKDDKDIWHILTWNLETLT